MQSLRKSRLYGISPKNTNRDDVDHWGKNQFNSSFPLALCLYMRDRGIKPVSVQMIKGRMVADDSSWGMPEIVGKQSDSVRFLFESSFQPFHKYFRNKIDNIDLVMSIDDEEQLPLEIKLTVVPDSATVNKETDFWAPELVMRPVSSAYAMMGVAYSLLWTDDKELSESVSQALRPAYNGISTWDSRSELLNNANLVQQSLKNALKIAETIQRPFLVQPIWRTKGQSLDLDENCLDVFLWSNVAVLALPVLEHGAGSTTMSRALREIARHVRSLYDVLQTGDFDYLSAYKGMSYGIQTDKAFSINGNRSIDYLKHPRLKKPLIQRTVLRELILDGGEYELKPERRFDAAAQLHMMTSKLET